MGGRMASLPRSLPRSQPPLITRPLLTTQHIPALGPSPSKPNTQTQTHRRKETHTNTQTHIYTPISDPCAPPRKTHTHMRTGAHPPRFSRGEGLARPAVLPRTAGLVAHGSPRLKRVARDAAVGRLAPPRAGEQFALTVAKHQPPASAVAAQQFRASFRRRPARHEPHRRLL